MESVHVELPSPSRKSVSSVPQSVIPVSYTHLDVYKRQTQQSDGSVATTEGMGIRLASVRLERGLTKVELARRIDLSATAIANIEKGAQTGVDVLESLAKALGVSPAWLAFGEGPREIPKKRRVRTVRDQSEHASR